MIRWSQSILGCIALGCILLIGSMPRPIAAEVTPAIIEIRPSMLDIERLVDEPIEASSSLNAWHNRIFLGVQRRLLSFDHRFLDPSEEAVAVAVPVSPFRLGVDLIGLGRDGSVDFETAADFDISLNLPNLEQSLDVFITTDALSESTLEQATESLRAGLRYDPVRLMNVEVGAKLAAAPVGFVAVRTGRAFSSGAWRIEPFLKVFAETDEGFGLASSVLIDRWRQRHLLRSSLSVRWLNETGETGWSYQFVSAHAKAVISPDRRLSQVRNRDLGDAAGFRLEAGGRSASGADFYEAGFFWKKPLHGRWLFLNVEPFVRFDRERQWSADPGLRIGLDALFWDVAR
jgi:hypothetical protein